MSQTAPKVFDTSIEVNKGELATRMGIDPNILASIITNGDLAKLNDQQLTLYYIHYCERLGLDPTTKPFDVITLKGRKVIYATRSCAAQIAKKHKVSQKITSREVVEGILIMKCEASSPDGRSTESIGAVAMGTAKGEDLANIYMKAETKAKRRATLDLIGLGVLDETELDSIKDGEQYAAATTVITSTAKPDISDARSKAVDAEYEVTPAHPSPQPTPTPPEPAPEIKVTKKADKKPEPAKPKADYQKLIDAFSLLNITQVELETLKNRRCEEWSVEDMVDLSAIAKTLRKEANPIQAAREYFEQMLNGKLFPDEKKPETKGAFD